MKYTAYETYIDYLFTHGPKSRDPYLDFRVDIVYSGDVNSYCPKDGTFTIPADQIKSIDTKKMTPNCKVDWQAALLGENNGQYAETDKTYDEVFNEPASGKMDQCKYAKEFAYKARLDALVKEYSTRRAEQEIEEEQWGGSGPRPADSDEDSQKSREDWIREGGSIADILATEYPFFSGYKESEYDQYGIPLTFLNGEEAAVTAKNWKIEGDSLSVSSGALISIDKPDTEEVIPIGYIDFMKTGVCNYYELLFDPTGLLKLK